MSFHIYFDPDLDEYSFKQRLISVGYAVRIVRYIDGSTKKIPWRISKLDLDSSLISNIRSFHDFRNRNDILDVTIKIIDVRNNYSPNTTGFLSLKPENYEEPESESCIQSETIEGAEIDDLIDFALNFKSFLFHNRKNTTLKSALNTCLELYKNMCFEKNNQTRHLSNTVHSNKNYAKALNRIQKWASRPYQENHKVIKAYFKAYEEIDDFPTKKRMEELCSNPNDPSSYVTYFGSTYASLKTDSSNSYGKVFEDDGERVWIWEGIEEELMKYKDYFLN